MYFYHMQYTYKIMLHKEPEGGFTVNVPALPGCITYGEDVDEAIAMAKEAITLYIEELQERGEDIPDDSNTLEYSLNLQTA
jgi:antitoxin HicB